MRAYVVLKGNGKEDEGYNEDIIKAFFNKKDAEDFVKSHNWQLKKELQEWKEKANECASCYQKSLNDRNYMLRQVCFNGEKSFVPSCSMSEKRELGYV